MQALIFLGCANFFHADTSKTKAAKRQNLTHACSASVQTSVCFASLPGLLYGKIRGKIRSYSRYSERSLFHVLGNTHNNELPTPNHNKVRKTTQRDERKSTLSFRNANSNYMKQRALPHIFAAVNHGSPQLLKGLLQQHGLRLASIGGGGYLRALPVTGSSTGANPCPSPASIAPGWPPCLRMNNHSIPLKDENDS